MYLFRCTVGLIHFVYYHHGFKTKLNSFRQHKSGLWHGPFKGVHQQYHAIRHIEYPFHLTAKVTVARRIQDVDLVILVAHGNVLSQDSDTPLPFQIIGIHDQFTRVFVVVKKPAGHQHFIHQGSLSVVYVSYNCYVSQVHINPCQKMAAKVGFIMALRFSVCKVSVKKKTRVDYPGLTTNSNQYKIIVSKLFSPPQNPCHFSP